MEHTTDSEIKLIELKFKNRKTVDFLKKTIRTLFGKTALEIIHIGSSAVNGMKTRPSYDFLVATETLDIPQETLNRLKESGFKEQKRTFDGKYILLLSTSLDSYPCYIYVAKKDSVEYWNFINFRDYLKINSIRRNKYEEIKSKIASYAKSPVEYAEQKRSITERLTEEARYWRILSQKYSIKSYSKVTSFKKDDSLLYLIGCELSSDNVFGKKVKSFYLTDNIGVNVRCVKNIAVLYNPADKSEILVFASKKSVFYQSDIEYVFDDLSKDRYVFTCSYEKSCGAVVYFIKDNEPLYLLIKNRSQNMGFPKGHVEKFEKEIQTAEREILEETNLQVDFIKGFRESYTYTINFCRQKEVVYFLARATSGTIHIPKREILSYSIVNFKEAMLLLTHGNEKKLLRDAHNMIMSQEKNKKE